MKTNNASDVIDTETTEVYISDQRVIMLSRI